ncbi:MAG: sensor histidine kinase, partial [Bacteroidota bacterium]
SLRLYALRSQLNPHFIFNTLNNLNATVELQPNRASEFILKLGDMLRYTLEDGQLGKVSLQQEISYLENYIYFQQQKGDENMRVTFTSVGDPPQNCQLEPMLLITLLENAFQHSYEEGPDTQRFVDISLELYNGKLDFLVRNSVPSVPVINRSTRKTHGLGLKNFQRRLELLYPNQYQFRHGLVGKVYEAHLELKTVCP